MRYHGLLAIRKVESMLGRKLTLIEKRVVEEEGYVEGSYKDDKGILTSGVGQTGKYHGISFEQTVKEHQEYVEQHILNFDTLTEELQAEFVQLAYRGDLQQSPTMRKLFNKGLYGKAARELLNHKEYRQRKKENGNDGVTRRLEAAYFEICRYDYLMRKEHE